MLTLAWSITGLKPAKKYLEVFMAVMRVALSERLVARLLPSPEGQYKVRDTEVKGLYLLVGKRRRTSLVQCDLRANGKRASSIQVATSRSNWWIVGQRSGAFGDGFARLGVAR
jgi:hypothetical protein